MGQGKPGKDGNDGTNGKDGKDGIGILQPDYNAETGELKFRMTDGNVKNVGNVKGKEGPIGKIDNDESVKKSIADKVLWCADGNICQLPKDVPIAAATGATIIKFNNGLNVNGGVVSNPGDKQNALYNDGLDIRQGAVRLNPWGNQENALFDDGLNIKKGAVRVNPGDKQNALYNDGLDIRQGAVRAMNSDGSNENYLSWKDGLQIRNGWIQTDKGNIQVNSGDKANILHEDGISIRNGAIRAMKPDGTSDNYLSWNDGLRIRNGWIQTDKGNIQVNSGDKANILHEDGLSIRSGKVVVNPGDKENVIHPWGVHLKQGHIYMEGRGDINQPRYIRFYGPNWGKCLDAGTFDESGRGKFNCANGNLNQLWNYDTSTGQVVNYDSNWNARCLTQDGDKVIMKNCGDGDLYQRWFKDEHHRLRRGNKCLDVGDNNANRLSDCANNDTNSNQVLAFTRYV